MQKYGWSVLGQKNLEQGLNKNVLCLHIYKLKDFEIRIEYKNKNNSIKLAAL